MIDIQIFFPKFGFGNIKFNYVFITNDNYINGDGFNIFGKLMKSLFNWSIINEIYVKYIFVFPQQRFYQIKRKKTKKFNSSLGTSYSREVS